jgi:predicted Zn-dependent protease
MLFLTHPGAPDTTLYSDDAAVATALGAAHDWGVQADVFVRAAKARRGARWAIPAWIGGLTVAGVLLFRSLDALVGFVPMEVDAKIGAFAKPQLLAQAGGPTFTDPATRKALRAITDRLVAASTEPALEVDLTIVDAPAVNAFALPGGYVVVYTGLLRDAAGPEEVAGVLAHELGHVTRRHGLRRLGRSAGTVLVIDTLLGDVAGLLGAAKEFFTLAAVNDYSREQEEDADLVGVRTLHAAGIDPVACRTFFERMQAEAGVLEKSEALAWISTHPSHAERIARIDAEVAALGPVTVKPLDVDWAAVKSAVGEESP